MLSQYLSEQDALIALKRAKASYQSLIVTTYERNAHDCRVCPTFGACCTDAHFVNVHITRLEAVAMRETIALTPRLSADEKRAVYQRAHDARARYNLAPGLRTFEQTYSCPLFAPGHGCVVHRRAKPSACIQHACYDNWEDLPPDFLQTRTEHRVEELNNRVYGKAWDWLPTPLWLTLVDPESDGRELAGLIRVWEARDDRKRHGPTLIK